MILELRQIIMYLNKHPDLCAVILTCAGNSFCAGADLRWINKIADQKREDRIAIATELSEILDELS